MIVFDCFLKLESCKIVQIKLTAFELDFLLHAWIHTNLLDIVVSVRCVEHFWCVVYISFLGNTCVDTNMCLALRINLKSQLKFVTVSNPL